MQRSFTTHFVCEENVFDFLILTLNPRGKWF